jgi:ketosteroid isomerase-like protein
MTDSDTASLVRRYIEAVSTHDLVPLESLLADDFVATFAGDRFDKPTWIAALQRLLPALLRNEIRDLYAEDGNGCVIYDFITDTPAGAVTCVERVTTANGRITATDLILDRVAFAPVNAALAAA